MKIATVFNIAFSLLASSAFATRCGEDYGACQEGQCCSKYGYCGITSEYCELTQGCQTEFGSCYASTSNGKCGKEFGRCPNPEHCCSKSGYCGTGPEYCEDECQSAYGICGDEKMPIEEDVEVVTEYVTETVYVYVEEKEDNRECGDGIGECKEGYCCSKYGYCGKTDAYCKTTNGCQSEYGECYETVDFAGVASDEDDVYTVVDCGSGIGSCINGECCNSEGKCGSTEEYCSVAKGCQENYGLCNSVSQVGECGEDFGKCPNPEHCCSKEGYCGYTDAYCSMSKGCQSDYGLCINDIEEDVYESDEEEETETLTFEEPECGEGIGSCADGACCSKDGLCGYEDSFCNVEKGCQAEFGLCNSNSPVGKCGEGYGRCPYSEQCCSKEGYCGTTEYYCDPDFGCQSLYGKCDATISNLF